MQCYVMSAKKALLSNFRASLRNLYKRKFSQIIIFVGVFSFFLLYPQFQLPDGDHPLKFYSTEHGHPLREITAQAIGQGKHSIYLRVFGLTDQKILKTLLHKSSDVNMVLEYDPKGGRPSLELQGLQAFQGSKLLHEKILIIDESLIFLGSLNFTESSFDLHQNLWAGIYSPQLAQALLNSEQSTGHYQLGEQFLHYYRMPRAGQAAKKILYQTLDAAQTSIAVCAFALTDKHLLQKLLEKQSAGVKVDCFFDEHLVTNTIKDSNLLYTVHSQSLGLMHHKWIMVDEETLFFGSANFSEAAFTKNEDIFLMISDLTTEQIKFFQDIMHALRKARSKKKSSLQ